MVINGLYTNELMRKGTYAGEKASTVQMSERVAGTIIENRASIQLNNQLLMVSNDLEPILCKLNQLFSFKTEFVQITCL